MNIVAGLVAGIALAVGVWLALRGGIGEAMSRKLCGTGIESVPCVLIGVVMAYVLPPVVGVFGGIVVWSKLSKKNRK